MPTMTTESTHTGLTLETATEIIANLKRLDLMAMDFDCIKEMVRPLFRGYKTQLLALHPRPLYRGNVYPNKPSNSQLLKYPPAERINNFQRANRPGCPMFYCSAARTAPFFEVGIKPGDHISISRWRTIERALIQNIGYHQDVFSTLESSRTGDVYKDIMPEFDPAFDPNDINYVVHKFLATEFAQTVSVGNEHRYKISAAIAELLLTNLYLKAETKAGFPSDAEINGIMYPALAMRANADNIVLRPRFVDKYMMLEQVEYIRIGDELEPMKHKYTFLDFANTFAADGTIDWKGRPQQWTIPRDGSITSREENGEVIFRDRDGNIVNPR